MGPVERRVRRMINPISTGLTARWCGIGPRRRVPPRAATSPPEHTHPAQAVGYLGVPSPGAWVPPAGLRPGWQWLPEYGAVPNLRAMPRWARIWYWTPLLDRYAYEWMWWHGGWTVLTPGTSPAPPPAGVREPRHPRPPRQSMGGMIDESTGEAIG